MTKGRGESCADCGCNAQAGREAMLVIMKNDATESQVEAVVREIKRMGYRGIPIPGPCERLCASQGMRARLTIRACCR